MKNILITGATGNIGSQVIRYLLKLNIDCNIIAGLRDVEKDKEKLNQLKGVNFVKLVFGDECCYDNALKEINQVFILRPPHITDIESYFRPFLKKVVANGIKEVVFLSVQGAEKSSIIPHHKLEKLIQEFELDYIFVRPSYFMQNLSTTLLQDIKEKRKIILPAKNAKFVWVDVNNIGETVALLLQNFHLYKNQAIEITGSETKSFSEVVSLMNTIINKPVKYQHINPISFYFMKRKQGLATGFVIVILILHFLPRFQQTPKTSSFYKKITGKNPTKITEFISREKSVFEE